MFLILHKASEMTFQENHIMNLIMKVQADTRKQNPLHPTKL